jgi:hypothetical protein
MNSLAKSLTLMAAPIVLAFMGCGTPAGKPAASVASPDLRYDFALIGDVPYDDQQITNFFPNMIEEMNRARLAFVVHDGDIKAGATPCTDASFERVHALFQTSRHPLIYLFGDNEWSDCGGVKTNAFDPVERLQKLRAIFTEGDRSLGQRAISLKRQSDESRFALFRENVRWTHGGVMFAGLNAPGDDNHFGTPEFGPRNAANIAWIQDAFAIATRENLRAVMLIMQANPHFDLAVTNRLRRGFNEMLAVIEKETLAFKKPVVLVHGDSHYFRIDQPLLGSRSRRRIEKFTRVETFGNPDVHWLRVSVDWRDPNVFRIHPQYVRKNVLRHQ